MNKRVITRIIVLMSISLFGIIGLQLYWISNAIRVKEEQFDRSINDALRAVAQKLETRETADLITKQLLRFDVTLPFTETPGSAARPYHHAADSVPVQLASYDSSRKNKEEILVRSTQQTKEGPAQSSVRLEVDSIPEHCKRSYDQARADSALTDSVHAAHGVKLTKNSREGGSSARNPYYGYHTRRLNHVMNQMIVELSARHKPLRDRINLPVLDSLLCAELEAKGIDLPYQYGVVSTSRSKGVQVISTSQPQEILHAKYKARLFPNDIFAAENYLLLSMPGPQNFVFRSLAGMLILSVVFTFIILFTFSSTLYFIFKQKKLSDIKTDFINNMTHEFKTPIATISLAVNNIDNPKVFADKDRIRHYTNIIRQENTRMNAQVENVLQMALLDKKELQMQLAEMDVHEAIQKAVQNLNLQVEQRQGQINVQLEARQHLVYADPIHFYNVLANLLDNANKYSPEQPCITVRTANENGGLRITVADKGLGMNQETQQYIFDRFYRLPTGNIHNIKGFGLGLSYVRDIVQAHKGHIHVKSELGKGSTFDVWVPLNCA